MRVRMKLAHGAKIDRNQVVSALARALAGPQDPSIWHLNEVPAIAQLEESLYESGTEDIRQAWEETARLLGLPVTPSLEKSTARLDVDGKHSHLKSRVRAAFFGFGKEPVDGEHIEDNASDGDSGGD